MPMYDYRCEQCGTVYDLLRPIGTEKIECPGCGSLVYAERVWLSKPAAVIGDECDITQENGFRHPQHFRSKSARRKALQAGGLEEMVRHVGVPGTDRSPETSNWAAIAPGTLEGARLMLERVAGVRSADQIEEEVDHAVAVGDVTVPIAVGGGRAVNVRIGSMYTGTINVEDMK